MNKPNPLELVDAMLDRELSTSELDELEQALGQSRSLRQRYLRNAQISAELEWELGRPPSKESLVADLDSDKPAVIPMSPRASFWSGVVVAACLSGIASAAALWMVATLVRFNSEVAANELGEDGHAEVVATLTGAVDCVWAEGAEQPVYGAAVKPGQELELLSGFVQLTFESGAKVVLEGPAKFTPHEKMYAALGLGKATAVVPQEAIGFQIDTPSAEIVDLGTSFGIDVSLSGESEVHVLEGEVLSRALASPEQDAFVHLVKDMALRFSPDSADFTTIEAAGDRFVTDVRPLLMPPELPGLPVQRSLALWLSADSLIEKDDAGRVVAWNDIRIGDNQSDETAWQSEAEYRPLWVESGIGGKPTVRFEGGFQHLVTTPLATTSNQSVFLVFAQHERPGPNQMRQLLSYNGPPVRILKDLTDPGVLQIDDQLQGGQFYGKIYMCIRSSQLRDSNLPPIGFCIGECTSKDVLPLDKPAVLTYIYAKRDNHSALYMDGKLQSTSDAMFDIAVNSRKVIGKHGKPQFDGFVGDISEVIIFNDRLTDDEVDQVNRYLIDKYELPSVSEETNL